MLIFSRGFRPLIARAVLFAAVVCINSALAEERILFFHSDITVNADASVNITETIRVNAEGVNIRRGIYRDFPTRYEDRFGNRYRVEFQVLGVYRNGDEEAFRTENRSNGVRVYIGNAQTYLPHGEHEYQLRYRSTRQLGFFKDFDELYWNVTGNGWMFAIEQAGASIRLPSRVPEESLKTALYTGYQGSTETRGESRIAGSGLIEFTTTAALAPRQGLTIAVGFPKGLVHEPSASERFRYFLSDNGAAIVMLLGLLVPLAWYLYTWDRHGRDPRKGVIIPRFKPPDGLSAAGCRYVSDMGMRNSAFTAAIISLGVKGYLQILELQKKKFTLYRNEDSDSNSATKGEAAVLSKLLPLRTSSIELDDKNYQQFQRARSALEQALKAEHQGRLFKTNTIFAVPAIIMSIIAILLALTQHGGAALWVTFGILTLFLHMGFLILLRAPTPAGRLILDEIEGFEMYLDTAEQSRLEQMKSPELTPEVFELFLPYAFALGVQNNWCERFAREFPQEVVKGGSHNRWYSGQHSGMDGLNHIGNNFSSSFSSAISSASSPPGSSSGSGGGGSSGGGGGGGGGGGW